MNLDPRRQQADSPDVRMRGFAQRATVDEALGWLSDHLHPLEGESISPPDSHGRVLSQDVVSELQIPGFSRAMMDGFAVRADDTAGASAYNRLCLEVVGESLPGRGSTSVVKAGTAIRIMTGAPVPEGADAVLPVEFVEADGERIQALQAVPPGKHIGLPGEDIEQGASVLSAGRQLRPQDVGLLCAVGRSRVEVVRQPVVRIVITGNELLPPGESPVGCQIVDSNGPMLAALIQRDGGIPVNPGIVADNPESILEALQSEADIVVVSGGSSVGAEDYAPNMLAEHGTLAIHGVAMRPSSPAGMGKLDNRLVFLLPGNPVSCLCAYDFFAGRAVRSLAGRSADWPYRSRRLPLERKLVSAIGRLDYARVQVRDESVLPLAIGGASVLSSTTRADGFVLVPADSEGFAAGTEVEVRLYD